MSVDLQDHAAKSIYYKVGDGATTSEEYEFRVPPKKCSTSSIKFIVCECFNIILLVMKCLYSFELERLTDQKNVF